MNGMEIVKSSRFRFLILFVSFYFSNTIQVSSQSIEFEVADCLSYVENEIDFEKTREARQDCENELVIVTFYPDTDVIELEIDIHGFRNDIYKMEPVSSTQYTWEEQRDSQVLAIDLKFNRLLGYLRSGTIEMTGRYKKDEQWYDHKDKAVIKFERK